MAGDPSGGAETIVKMVLPEHARRTPVRHLTPAALAARRAPPGG
jgi:hypothetical protein